MNQPPEHRPRTRKPPGRVGAIPVTVLAIVLTACGGSSSVASGENSVCALVKPADQAVLSRTGPYVGRESALAAAFRKAPIPKQSSADPQDVAFLARMRSETAHDIDAVAKVPKGDSEALDTAKGAVEDDLAAISGNGLCASAAGGEPQARSASPTNAPSSTAASSTTTIGGAYATTTSVVGTVTGPSTTVATVVGLPSGADRSDTGPVSFISPSKNIGCVITESRARCDIKEHDWQPPPKPSTCNLDWGSALTVAAQGAGEFRCVGDTAIGGVTTVLVYGSLSRHGPFECRSEATGMECVNLDTGHGIAVSRGEYKLS